ncbi:Bromodomain protein [Dictyocaulus viviparus]|uniref:Bromodomain protein n=1 Tax=Dictyocaulus viviparus TaxID=29172 RepID=A0A0D8X7S9_DICVI|nr:Bromodomain protein [Dictyocaulus viviparus]
MGDEERVERRSMVGAPPTARKPPSAVRSSRWSRISILKQNAKRKQEEESGEEHDSGSERQDSEAGDVGEEDSGAEEQIGNETPGKPRRKRRRVHLTDYSARKKQREKEKEKLRKAGLLDEPSAKSASVEPEEKKTPPPDPSESIMKTPSINRYSPLQLMADHLLRKIMSKDPEEYFAFPVTSSMASDYHNIISQPMDFSKMRQKIEDDAYQTITEMKTDAELIVSNALTYNNPNTVYHLAATRLSAIVKYYFSEQYLRYIFHTLPFANQIPLEKAGLAPLAVTTVKHEDRRRQALVDDMTGEDCLIAADPATRPRLSDGATVLNVIGEGEKKGLKLGDIIGPLEEGTPGMLSLGDHRLSGQSMITYLNYGPFASFAPQYDSTWATLTKQDSDLLLRTYGDRSTVADVMSLRDMVSDAGSHFIKVVAVLLATLPEGEHSRAMAELKEKDEVGVKSKDVEDIGELLDEVESLENLGVDVSFVQEIRQNLAITKSNEIQSQLDMTGRAVIDLARIQHKRLSQPPPVTLTNVPTPSTVEIQLAGNIQRQLVSQVAAHAPPGEIVSAPAIHNAMGIQDELDMDIFGEFFVAAHAPPGEIVSAPAIHNAMGIQDELDMDIFGEFFVT